MAALRDWRANKVATSAEPGGVLSASERDEFTKARAVVRRGLGNFVAVGNSLRLIRDCRLYRETHETFEQFCREEWGGMTRTTANRQIGAAVVSELLAPFGATPLSEAVVRPLTKLREDLVKMVWQRAIEQSPQGSDGQPRVTADAVQQAAAALAPKRNAARKKPKSRRPVIFRVDGGKVVVTVANSKGDVVKMLAAALKQSMPKEQRKAAA